MVPACAQKGEARDGCIRAGLDEVQLRFATGLTSEDYVKQEGWRSATLDRCPLHPAGGCGFARHTAYERVEPPGAFIARYYCPEGHVTFSLQPDCLASRVSSTLDDIETAVIAMNAGPSREVVAEKLRPQMGTQGAVRWLRRRAAWVAVTLLALKGLRPDLFAGAQPTLDDFKRVLGVERVLPHCRELAGAQLAALPPPVGFGPRLARGDTGERRAQQGTGADPPKAGA
jgi:hypothetical protein